MMAQKLISRFMTLMIVSGLMFVGCKKDNPVDSTLSSAVYDDAAYSISGAVGDQSGGATESFGDLLTVQSQGSINKITPLMDGGFEKTTADSGTYDPSTGWWTVSINKTRSNDRVTASVTRTYQFRFWKNDTVYQPFYVTGGDTATKMEFKIINGTGYFKNPHITHHLTQLQGAWLATNINKDTVTISLQENYIRKGVDSVVTMRATRIFDHTLTLTSVNVTTLRFKPTLVKPFAVWRANLANAISGTISGHISATATIIKGENDNVRTIDKDFTVTVGGGNGSISINGNKYSCNMMYGDRP